MPLETNIPIKPGMVMHMVATEVKSEKVDASKFIVPEGYEITTMEEVQKKMSGKD
jgi:hypothetical protein